MHVLLCTIRLLPLIRHSKQLCCNDNTIDTFDKAQNVYCLWQFSNHLTDKWSNKFRITLKSVLGPLTDNSGGPSCPTTVCRGPSPPVTRALYAASIGTCVRVWSICYSITIKIVAAGLATFLWGLKGTSSPITVLAGLSLPFLPKLTILF